MMLVALAAGGVGAAFAAIAQRGGKAGVLRCTCRIIADTAVELMAA
jgi:hypothetical protein